MRPTTRTTPWHTGARTFLGALAALLMASGTAHADEPDHNRLTLTLNVPYLLVPIYQVNAELALRPRWSVAVRGGAGTSDLGGVDRRIMEFGAQGTYYVRGNVDRGVQLGVDARIVSYEGDGMLMGLGDGLAAGPFVGYKRTFGRGFTLQGQLGVQVVATGKSEDRVLPFLALSAGWSFLGTGDESDTAPTASPPPGLTSARRNPLDDHTGFTFGASIGGGTASIEGCGSCKLEPGIAVDASVGWFVHRRVAVMADSTAIVALFSLSSGFGSFGFGLTSLAVQYWPHEQVWLKAGVGVAQLSSLSLGGSGSGFQQGGGGTLAVGYEVHHERGFSMDVQLRATHGSFDSNALGQVTGVDSFVGLLGFRWY